MPLIVLDAGHGGANPGATYKGRKESEDALALTLAVGSILEENGVDVYYTRTTDIYESPYQKAQEGNEVGGDYFVSIHRNSSPYPNQYSGVESLVYNRYGAAARMAYNINAGLEQVGFVNLGVNERPNLVVLNSTNMPAVLVEVGLSIRTRTMNSLTAGLMRLPGLLPTAFWRASDLRSAHAAFIKASATHPSPFSRLTFLPKSYK